MNLDYIIYKLVLNRMMKDVNICFINENIEKITLSSIPMEVKERGNYTWLEKAYESEYEYDSERKNLQRELNKCYDIMN